MSTISRGFDVCRMPPRQKLEIKEVDFDYYLDNSCDLSQPYQGQALKVVHSHNGKTACYVVHPDDVGELSRLIRLADKKLHGRK